MSKFTDLKFTEKEKVAVDFSKLKERGPRMAPPQPGHGYIFQLPKISLESDIWEEIETEAGRRLGVSFRDGAELILVTSPLEPSENGGLIGWRADNVERKFSDDQDPFSKLALLLKAAGNVDLTDASSVEYAKALVALSGKRFSASITWNARCSPDRDIYRVDPETGNGEVMVGVVGCGQRYGMKQKVNKKTGEEQLAFPKDPETGKLATRFLCATETCEGSISPFVDLQNFRGVEPDGNGADNSKVEKTPAAHGKQQAATK